MDKAVAYQESQPNFIAADIPGKYSRFFTKGTYMSQVTSVTSYSFAETQRTLY